MTTAQSEKLDPEAIVLIRSKTWDDWWTGQHPGNSGPKSETRRLDGWSRISDRGISGTSRRDHFKCVLKRSIHTWDLIHTELLDEVSLFTEEQIEAAPHSSSQSLRQIVVNFAALERFQIGHLVGGHRFDRPVTRRNM